MTKLNHICDTGAISEIGVLRFVEVCCSCSALQCVAVRCSVLQRVGVYGKWGQRR